MHQNSILLYQEYILPKIKPNMRILEIGPNDFPSSYQKLAPASVKWETLDIYDSDKLTYSSAQEYAFPIEDNQYDMVISGQVMEHVKKIWLWIKEIERVCKPGGMVATISPVSWPYHEAPVDCWRIYPEGMKALLEDTSLEIIICKFETLEHPEYWNFTPGISLEYVKPKLRRFYKFIGKFGYPIEKSLDLVTISIKK